MRERVVKVTDLVGVAEIAERMGVATTSVHKWHARHPDFPAPIARLSAALVWAWSDVERWGLATGRLPVTRAH